MDHFSPIHGAARDGDGDKVLRLIYQDPQLVHTTDRHGFTPLFYASLKGPFPVVAALVDYGANIDHQGHYGSTALYCACSNGHVPVVELLLEKGANPTLATRSGRTPLMTASFYGRVGVVARLLHHPSVLSTIDYRNNNGETALYVACWRGQPNIVRMLLEAGTDPTIRSNDGKTAMDIATERGRQECVSLLKEWDRSYTITKARLLYDAFCRYQLHQHHRQQQGRDDDVAPASSSGGGCGQASSASNKRRRVEAAIPTYLKGRMEGGQPLPKVVMVDGYEEGSLVESVLEYVICGGLKGELFVEFMELMGKTGHRQEDGV